MLNPRIYANFAGSNWFPCDCVPCDEAARDIHGLHEEKFVRVIS